MTAKRENHAEGKTRRSRTGQTLSARTLAIHQKQARACELRTMGWDVQKIADHLGYRQAAAAWKAIEAAKKRNESPIVEALRDEQDAQLRLLSAKVWTSLDGVEDRDTLYKGALVLVKILERQSKLFGADAPVKSEISGDGQITVSFHTALQPIVVEQDSPGQIGP